MIKDQKVRAAPETLIPLEGAIRAVEIRQRSLPGAGSCAQRNCDTGNLQAVSQQFSCVNHLSTACGDHPIAGLPAEIVLDPLKIQFTAIVFQILLINRQASGIEIPAEP